MVGRKGYSEIASLKGRQPITIIIVGRGGEVREENRSEEKDGTGREGRWID